MNLFQEKLQTCIKVRKLNAGRGDNVPYVNVRKNMLRLNYILLRELKLNTNVDRIYYANYYVNKKDNTLIIELCNSQSDGLYRYSTRNGASSIAISKTLQASGLAALAIGSYPIINTCTDKLSGKYYVEIPLHPEYAQN